MSLKEAAESTLFALGLVCLLSMCVNWIWDRGAEADVVVYNDQERIIFERSNVSCKDIDFVRDLALEEFPQTEVVMTLGVCGKVYDRVEIFLEPLSSRRFKPKEPK